MLDLQNIYKQRAEETINRIGSNIFKAGITGYRGVYAINRTGQYFNSAIRQGSNASGKTIQSMRSDVNDKEIIIYGRNNFDRLEKGTPPNTGVTASEIFTWSEFKGIETKNRKKFAIWLSNRINRFGSALYRYGGRDDIYSNESDILIKALSEDIRKEIINTKIIEDGNNNNSSR